MNNSIETLLEYIEDEKCKEYLNAILIASKMMDLQVDIRYSTSFIDLHIEKGRVKSMGYDKSIDFQFDINYKKKYLKDVKVTYSYIVHTNEKTRGPHTPYVYYKTEKIGNKFNYDFLSVFEAAYEKFGLLIAEN